MKFDRNPSGLFPFHLCSEGLDHGVMCRDDEDYDQAVKYLHLSVLASNMLLPCYCVLSNHYHCIVLAKDRAAVCSAAASFKKRYSMYYAKKYATASPLGRSHDYAVYLDNDRYLRNAIAYVLRNAKDQPGGRIDTYPWSSFSAYFQVSQSILSGLDVRTMGPDEKRKRFHSHDVPSTLPWRLDTCGRLIPASTVYHEYVERTFFNDYEFFMRTLFRNLDAEMEELLERYPKKGLNDSEFLKLSEEKAHDRYGCSLSQLSRTQKISLVKLLYHSVRTNAKQLARISGFTVEEVNGFVRSRQVRLNTSGPDGGIGLGGL